MAKPSPSEIIPVEIVPWQTYPPPPSPAPVTTTLPNRTPASPAGLALGMKSAILPITLISITVWLSFQLVGMYGVALAALGMPASLCSRAHLFSTWLWAKDVISGIPDRFQSPSETLIFWHFPDAMCPRACTRSVAY